MESEFKASYQEKAAAEQGGRKKEESILGSFNIRWLKIQNLSFDDVKVKTNKMNERRVNAFLVGFEKFLDSNICY